MNALVTGLTTRRQRTDAFLGLQRSEQFLQFIIGCRRLEAVLLEDILAIRQHRGFRTVGQAVELGTGAGQIALLATDETQIFQITLDDVVDVVIRISQCGVLEIGFDAFDQILFDVLALPHDDVANGVVIPLRLGHFQQLLVLHAADGDLVDFDLDAGFGGELGQDLEHRVVMRVRRDVHDHGLALVFGVAILCKNPLDQRKLGRCEYPGHAACLQ